ncbi:hypothetical protein BDV25DRAFT_143657 [Aspergillus avenaceus]|uniref:Uncharacterized protein n=1 Tax=Aspergillus avenaceus TaxID=36643 RepID=A0A5N6TJH3_ASPAV|nr:hypothetical protein BDV25DRAFT_143657 [Aspergillus avenaceus]
MTVPNDDNIEWQDAKTDTGKPYRTGIEKISSGDEANPAEVEESSASNTVRALSVHWPVDNTWHDAPPDVWNLGIISYKVEEGGVIWKYRISFRPRLQRTYYFTDETNDTYQKWAVNLMAVHTIDYNSDKPAIVRLSC